MRQPLPATAISNNQEALCGGHGVLSSSCRSSAVWDSSTSKARAASEALQMPRPHPLPGKRCFGDFNCGSLWGELWAGLSSTLLKPVSHKRAASKVIHDKYLETYRARSCRQHTRRFSADCFLACAPACMWQSRDEGCNLRTPSKHGAPLSQEASRRQAA